MKPCFLSIPQPLHHAARGEHADVIRMLLASGASPTKANLYGKVGLGVLALLPIFSDKLCCGVSDQFSFGRSQVTYQNQTQKPREFWRLLLVLWHASRFYLLQKNSRFHLGDVELASMVGFYRSAIKMLIVASLFITISFRI